VCTVPDVAQVHITADVPEDPPYTAILSDIPKGATLGYDVCAEAFYDSKVRRYTRRVRVVCRCGAKLCEGPR
jgi:hypothetical protein